MYSSSTKEPKVSFDTDWGCVFPKWLFPTTAVFACTFAEYSNGPNVSLFYSLDGVYAVVIAVILVPVIS